MSRLMKAEIYRFLHSGAYLRILIMSCLLLMLLPLAMDYELLSYTFAESLENFGMSYMMFLMFGTVILAVAISSGYTKKIAYYEVMAGSKPRDIICSKLWVEGILVGSIILVSIGGLGIVAAVRNGIGEMEQLGTRMLLILVVFFHVTFVAVLMGITTKSIAAGMLAYFRFCIMEIMITMLLPILMINGVFSENVCRLIDQTLLVRQMGDLFGEALSTQLVVSVLASFVVEVVLWYGVAYYTLKKRLYK